MPKLSAAEFGKRDCDPQGQWCLLYGSEYELKVRLREGIVERVVAPAERDYAVETIAAGRGAKAADILGRARTASALTAARVLVVDAIENLPNPEQRALARGLAAAPGTTVVLIESTRASRGGEGRPGADDRKGRLSAELIKAVAEAGSVVECAPPGREEAAASVREHAQALGSSIRPAAAALLVERVGLDLGLLAREVEKLALLAQEGEITRQHVEEATPRTPEDNIFAVGDAIGAGDVDQAVAVLRDLMQYQGVEPTTALAFIARQFRLIWQTKVLLDAGWRPGREVPNQAQSLLAEGADVLRYLDGRRWLVNRLAGQARRFSWAQLAQAVRRLLAAELALKGIAEGIGDPRIALEVLVVDLCRRRG